ncbi:MAG: hypothetical protein IPG72_14915 [Ardenticatenales bacterium]|nr:hypothetical protein [Ardenticatenales bacterium]
MPGRFLAAAGIDVADDGQVYVADAGAGRVHVLAPPMGRGCA